MSTILKALRRLEDDEASRRAEQPAELREHVVGAPARPEPGRARVWIWLLAIPAAGITGALAAALLLPVVLGRNDPPSSNTPAASTAVASSPEAAAPLTADTARAPALAAAPAPAGSAERVSAPRAASPAGQAPLPLAGAPSPFSPAPASAGSALSPALAATPSTRPFPAPSESAPLGAPGTASPAPERAPGVSSPTSSLAPGAVAVASQPVPEWAVPAPARALGVSSPATPSTPDEPPALPPVTSARPLEEESGWAESARRIEISDDVAVIERNPVPRLLVSQTIWHPRSDRRVAVVERLDAGDGGEVLRLREGDRVGPLQLVAIEPTGVVFSHNGVELRRRVGALP